MRATLEQTPHVIPLRLRPAGPVTGDQARAEADQILAEAQIARDNVLAAAQQEGYEAGMAQARAELASAIAAVQQMAAGLAEERERLEEEVLDGATLLAIEAAAKVVRAEIATRPELVTGILRTAIRRAADRERLVVHVNPEDLAICRDAAPEIMERMGGIDVLRVVDEPRVTRGGCIVEGAGGDVDATLQTQLARIAEAVSAPPDESLL